ARRHGPNLGDSLTDLGALTDRPLVRRRSRTPWTRSLRSTRVDTGRLRPASAATTVCADLPKPLANAKSSPAQGPGAGPGADPQALVSPEEAFRAQPPAAGAPRPFRLPPVQVFTLASGIQVYLVEQHTLPLVSMDFSFDGGAAVDPPGKEGLASVCMAMLTEGTEQLDKLAYAERLADTASSIGGYAGDESGGVAPAGPAPAPPGTVAQVTPTLRAPGGRPGG